ncbi:hypothetical protein R83H12_02350 [Fibrobacteria bacterium R8-3-H12]
MYGAKEVWFITLILEEEHKMATLYIFAIGGSGSKVVESLTMLLDAAIIRKR